MLSTPGSATPLTAVSFGQRLPTLALSAGAFLAPLLAIYAPLGMAPLFVVMAAALAIGWLLERRPIRIARPAIWIAVGCLLAWGTASLIWTINPKGALVTLGQLSGFLLCAVIAVTMTAAADRRPIVRALLIGVLAALVIFAIERMFGAPIHDLIKPPADTEETEAIYSAFNRGLAVLIVLVPVIIMAFRKAWPWLCVLVAGASVAIASSYVGAAMALAAAVAIAVFVAALVMGPWLIRAIAVIAVIVILAAPFVAHSLITPDLVETVSRGQDTISVQHRLIIWRFVSEKIMEKPLLGWGLDSARAIPGGKNTAIVHSRLCQAPCKRTGEYLPLHPHNIAMQLWLELGLVGAALGATIVLTIFWAIAAVPVARLDRALLAAQASAGLVIAGLSYGAWQVWWLSALALAGVLALCALGQRNDQDAE